MNVQNTITVSQEINLDTLGLVPRDEAVSTRDLGRFSDKLREKVHAFAAIVELLSACNLETLEPNRLYWLLNQQEQGFNSLIDELEELIAP